jgi:hypothetical protein
MSGVRTLSACLAAALTLGACSPAKAPDADAASSQGPDLSFYLQPAFRAAFGADAPAPHEIVRPGGKAVMQFSPHLIADLGDGRVALISTGAPAASDCQDCGGAVAVHYLRRVNGEFHVEGQWFDPGPFGASGDLPVTRVRGDLFAHPALEDEFSGRNQGCENASVDLFELTLGGPVLRAGNIPTARSNIAMGAVRVGPMVDDNANILPEVKGEHFRVEYRGTLPGTLTFAPAAGAPGGLWTSHGDIKLPDC